MCRKAMHEYRIALGLFERWILLSKFTVPREQALPLRVGVR